MATQRSSFGKMQRDRDKKAKAAAKRERRQERQAEADAAHAEAGTADAVGELSTAELLEQVEAVHRELDAGTIDFDTFEERKAALLARLTVE